MMLEIQWLDVMLTTEDASTSLNIHSTLFKNYFSDDTTRCRPMYVHVERAYTAGVCNERTGSVIITVTVATVS